MIKAIIFDFDDTLIDNQLLDYQSFKKTSTYFNLVFPTKKELKKLRYNNLLASQIITWIIQKSNVEFDKELFIKKRNDFLQSFDSINYLIIHPHVKNTLKFLKKNKIKIIICSLRTKKKIIQMFLQKNKLTHYVDMIINNESSQITKNSINIKTQLYNKLLRNIPYSNNEILSIGDSIDDQNAAELNQIYHISFRSKNDSIRRPKLRNQMYSFKEIPDFLNRIDQSKQK